MQSKEGAIHADTRHVYVHVPFCARKCAYCDFSIAVRKTVPVDEYLRALESELSLRFSGRGPAPAETIYFGGGTPSRLGGEGVARAVEIVSRFFPPSSGAEITVEANPEDVSLEAAGVWRVAGVNRLSLGAQSFDDEALRWMHRTHDSAATTKAVAAARGAGINNLSLDLIFALPGSLQRNLTRDVERLVELGPDHISLYGLTVEPQTPLGKWVGRGVTIERGEDGYESEFMRADELLTGAGFEHYEVSNYAKPGRRSRHNSSYWSGTSYVGVGPSSHEFDGTCRRWNARNYTDWRDALTEGRDPLAGSETLSAENRIAEQVYLGLRTNGGLQLLPGEAPVIDRWIAERWVTVDANSVMRCTPLGWLRLDALAAALTHHRSR